MCEWVFKMSYDPKKWDKKKEGAGDLISRTFGLPRGRKWQGEDEERYYQHSLG